MTLKNADKPNARIDLVEKTEDGKGLVECPKERKYSVVAEENLEIPYEDCMVNVNCVDEKLRTPLMLALNSCEELETRAEIARILLEHRADPNKLDKKGLSATHFAALHANLLAMEV